MCVIIAKNKESRLPTITELKNCFTYNSDGAGFMYTDNNEVVIDKGYMDWENFKNKYDELCEKYNDFINKSLVIHCRITTDGSTSAKNCHPFALCDNIKKMQKSKTTSTIGVAHNGIISDYRPKQTDKRDINDTILFIEQYLAPIQKQFKDFYKNQAFLDGVELITNSKFAFLDNNDFLSTCGNFIDENGLLFSNSSYLSYNNYNYNYNYNYNNNFYYDDYEIVDDYDDVETVRDKDYLIKLDDNYFAEIPNENEVDDYAFDILTIAELKIDDNSTCYYNPYNYSIYEISAEGIELQKISYVNVYSDNYELIF